MQNKEKKTNRKIILDIVLYTICFIFFGFALFGTIVRFSQGEFYLFGNRFDVVLTDSMSSKHEDHLDFLEGHNDQYQKMDLVISKKVKKPGEIKLYDVVIFNDKILGTNMHRIVNLIEDKNDKFTLIEINKGEINQHKGIFFKKLESSIVSNEIVFTKLEMTVFTTENDASKHFNFNVLSTDYNPEIKQEIVDGGYLVTYSVNKESKAPGKLVIAHHKEYDFSKEIVLSIKLNAEYADIDINYDSDMIVDNDISIMIFNQTYLYEIRGDKQKDGEIYALKDIKSRVTARIPGGGYLARYLSSIWGMIMFIGLGFGCIIVEILLDRNKKKIESQQLASVNDEGKKEEQDE